MHEFFAKLFDGSDFPARWHCGNWTEALGWLHVLSDVAIFLAYLAIPVVLAFFLTRRKDIPFPRVLWLFVAFICSCGFGHLVEAIIFWHPIYRFSGLIKLTTAIVSSITVGAVVYTIPYALRLRSPEELEREVERRTAELAERAQELEALNRELDEFVSAASHDLRTPLDGVRTLAGFILEDNADRLPEKSQQHLAQMQQRIDRLSRLLDDLLHYSRVGGDDGRTTVDVAALVDDLRTLLDPPEGFEIVADGELPRLETNRTPLVQVLQNLVDNALKHHDRDRGRIAIGCREVAGVWEFSVSDDGPGIEPQYHEQIFRLFERLKPQDEVEGSGMGLALVRKLVERQGGTIRVESSGGRGTTFRFTWPSKGAG